MKADSHTDRAGEADEALALSALGYILEDDRLRDRFLDLSGLDAEAVRAGLGDRAFLASVLEFLINFEPDLIAFAAHADLPPETVVRSWRALGGGAGQEW